MLVAARGFKIALLADDGFSKLLATGLTAVFAIQAFVIIGGVTRVIPLTGVTLPFVSYGGSSIVANFVLLALLLLISDRARREARGLRWRGRAMNRQIVKLFGFIVVLFAVLIGFTSYWSVFDAKALKEKEANKRPLLEQQQIKRGRILAADGTVIARSVAKGHGAGLRYVRRYPEGALFGHPIGYSFVRQGDSEFEQYHNDELVGNESEFGSILDQLTGQEQEGNDIVTNIDPEAQRTRWKASKAPASAPSSRSNRAPARSGCWPRTRPMTPTGSPTNSRSSTSTKRKRRWSTAAPRPATRRARPSRW